MTAEEAGFKVVHVAGPYSGIDLDRHVEALQSDIEAAMVELADEGYSVTHVVPLTRGVMGSSAATVENPVLGIDEYVGAYGYGYSVMWGVILIASRQ